MEALRLLLVDDNAAFLSIATRFLRSNPDFEQIAAANTAAEGLALAERLQPQVVLLDINLADSSGLEAIPRLRALLPQVKIIMLTVWDTDAYRQAARAAGADDYVTKDNIHSSLVPAIWRQLRPLAPIVG
jgi:DNA-binding NarL/FixJ family response regulator